MSQENRNLGIFSEMTEKAMGNDKSIEAMFHNIPGGIVMYEWDGKKLKTLHISEHYAKQYGSSLVSKGANDGGPDFIRVHPDDVMAYQKAVVNAINTTQKLEYVYRVWNDEANRYLWTKINASSKRLEDGKSIIYALYTDVTAQMDSRISYEKSQAILKAALKASGQYCFEYDTKTGVITSLTGRSGVFNLSNQVENFPDNFFENKIIYIDDVNIVKDTIEQVKAGIENITCEVRLLTGELYRWYSFHFQKYYDRDRGYNIAIGNFTDITYQKEAIASYQHHIETVMRLNPDAIGTVQLNVTQNKILEQNTIYENIRILGNKGTVTGYEEDAEKRIMNSEERSVFRKRFHRTDIIKQFAEGITQIRMEHRYLLKENENVWLETILDLVRNPNSGDIEGILYVKNINARKIESIILKETMHNDYEHLAIFYRKGDIYYHFAQHANEYCIKYNHFWEEGMERAISIADESERERLRPYVTKEYVLKQLENYGECSVTFKGTNGRRYIGYYSLVSDDAEMVICAIRDITDSALLEEVRYAATHDLLTGLYNREKTFKECNKLLTAYPDETFYMVHFDIQRFRLYNSFFGDAEGDRLLKYLADMIVKACALVKKSVYGRIEADDFMICLPCSKDDDVNLQEQYIRQALTDYRNDFLILANSGVYVIKDRKLSAEVCYNRAAIAAKNNYNNQTHPVKFFDDTMEHQLHIEQKIGQDMQTAIDEEQFVIYLQPKYQLSSGEAYGAEALVRWIHPERGLVAPGEFIPLFESNGFITTLDQYMWEHTCQLIRKWLDEGRKVAPISVNVSRVSMYSPQIVQYFINLIERYNIPVKLLNLELTESAYMDNPKEMKARLEGLRAAGFEIMMDDFGSGYSSLNTLREIPVDYLKVDRVFLASVDRDKRSRLVLSSVVHMASRMGIPVITEGVETDEQCEFLASIGCDYVQGYLYAKPMPVSEYEKNILDKNSMVIPTRKNEEALISKITMNMDVEVQSFADLLPHAVAFVDYAGGEFSYLSANKTFQTVFGMHSDVEDMSELVENHITKENYELLISMYQKIAKTRSSSECFLSWKDNQDHIMYYLVRAQYLGNSAYSTIMISTFINLTEFSKKVYALTEITQERLMEKDIYTMKEINSYVYLLNQSFDIARLVCPETMKVITTDVNDKPVCMPGKCHSFFGKAQRCEHCITWECAKSHQNRYKIEKKCGEYYLVTSHPVNVCIGNDEPVDDYVIETFTKLTDEILDILRESKQDLIDERITHLQDLVYEDPLTMVYNRRYFRDMKFLKEPEPGFRKGDCVAFVIIDLKSFKKINDIYGRTIGDEILIQTATMLCKRTRMVDSVIRYGDDEFLVVFNNCTEENVRDQIQRIREAMAEIRYTENQTLTLNVNIGYSFRQHFNGSFIEAQEMIKEADKCMCKQKVKA